MNSFKQLLVAGALAVAGITAAHADTIVRGTEYLPMDSAPPGVFVNTWTLSSDDLTVYLDLSGGTGSLDFFVFNVPDTEYVSFTATGSTADFYAYALYLYGSGDLLASNGDDQGASLSTDTFLLTSGTYELDLYNADDTYGSYQFQAIGAPVPEPGSMALLLAGLGAMGVLARRRGKQAN